MIWPVVRTGITNLRRDRNALLLTFLLPIVFFSIFALVFGGRGTGINAVKIAVVDQDGTEVSQRLVKALEGDKSLRVMKRKANKQLVPHTRETAETAVRQGDVSAAVIIAKGFGESPIAFGPSSSQPRIELLHDSADQIAAPMVNGLLQKAAMTSMPDVMAGAGTKYLDAAVGGLLPAQKKAVEDSLESLRKLQAETNNTAANEDDSPLAGGLVQIESKDLVGANKRSPMIAFYAAGVGVMFLLFSASGAGGALLEEVENGTLDRVLSTRVGMLKLLVGKLVFLSLMGFTQLCVMFVWGALVFKLDLFSHLSGFLVMTAATAVAASALGLLLASACKTRQQLGALSTLIILTMSALGGSMFPRFLMPEAMQKVGLVTFNAWALDGFTKIFWRDEPVTHLWPQVLVLTASAVLFFAIARKLAKRWEYA